jgi:hypothetical protein
MVIVCQVQAFVDINDREGEGTDMAILHDHAGPLHLVPMVDCPVGIAHEIGRRIVRQSHVLPIVDAVG